MALGNCIDRLVGLFSLSGWTAVAASEGGITR